MNVYKGTSGEVKNIYLGEGKEYNDMQGPCPDGFHVPTKDELTSLNNILKLWNTYSWNLWRVCLHMPYAGSMSATSGGSVGGGSKAYYWSSTWDGDRPVSLYMQSNKLNIQADYYTTNGMPIRPFKDEPVAADSNWTLEFQGTWGGGIYHNSTLGLISISWDGSTWTTIADKNLGATVVYNDGDTLSAENCGKYYQRGNNYGFPKSGATTTSTTLVNASSYGPGNYYNSDTFIKSGVSNWDTSNNANLRGGVSQGTTTKPGIKEVYIGTTKVYPGIKLITTPGIYHDEVNGLISFSTDGENWTTIADKNLGATSSDITSSDSYGNLYQWGNNYGFPYAGASGGTISKSSTKVNAGSYGPGNYYSGSTFIYSGSENGDWSSSQNDNLWGNTTNTLVARRGPCDEGFHVPTNSELTGLLSSLKTITGLSTITGNNLGTYILLPVFGRLSGNNGSWASNNYRFLWSSTVNGTTSYYLETANTTGAYTASVGRAWGFSVRPFKNTPVTPDESWTIIYFGGLKSYTEICQLTAEGAVTELNKYPADYYNKLSSEGHILNNSIANSAGTGYQPFPREGGGNHYVMYNNGTWIDTL